MAEHKAIDWDYSLNIKCSCGERFRASRRGGMWESITMYGQHVADLQRRPWWHRFKPAPPPAVGQGTK